MILGCREDAKASDGVVYLVALRWDACDPLQKVQGVLAAKLYNDASTSTSETLEGKRPDWLTPSTLQWIRAEAAERAAEQRRLAAAQAPPVSDVAFSHQQCALKTPCNWQVNSLGHSHLPSLTSRQARRSGLSQEQLMERWAQLEVL